MLTFSSRKVGLEHWNWKLYKLRRLSSRLKMAYPDTGMLFAPFGCTQSLLLPHPF